MTFNEWCAQNKIEGNWQDALLHSLMSRYGRDGIKTTDEAHWQEQWGIVLGNALTSMQGSSHLNKFGEDVTK